MPSASYLQGAVGRQLSSVSFQVPVSFRPNDVLISPLSACAVGEELAGMVAANSASAAYPAASRVLAFPFEIADPFLVVKVWWLTGTTTGTDSCDVGVYTEAGTTLLVSGGSTLISAGNDTMMEKDCTDTLIPPGRYWCAYVQGGTTATPRQWALAAALLRAMGWAQMAGSGSTLGATFTPAAVAGASVPLFGIAGRTQVA